MASKTRLYCVKSADQVRLVEATNPASARSYVARKEYSVEIPAQHEIYAMARDGVQIELAVEELSETSRMSIGQVDFAA